MLSLRHTPLDDVETAALDAARASILEVGWSRTTLTEVARRAGVSRMTLYRRFPDMRSILAELMTRELVSLVDAEPLPARRGIRRRIVDDVVATVRGIRDNPLFRRILELDGAMLLPYLLERPGRSQDLIARVLDERLRAGQEAGEVRAGDPALLARSVLLATHGFALSVRTMTGRGRSAARFDEELARLLDGYLRP